LIKERQREGIAAAKDRGAYRGRKRALTADQVANLKEREAHGDTTRVALAKEFGISRQTLYMALDDPDYVRRGIGE
jgi:DNA invertase Pin-like site-specific DNA recombinase